MDAPLKALQQVLLKAEQLLLGLLPLPSMLPLRSID